MSALPGASGTARSASAPTAPSRRWIAVLVRAVLVLALGSAITFSSDHSAELGALLFGAFAVLSVLAGVALQGRALLASDRRARALGIAQLAITLLAGIAALVVRDAGIGALVAVLSPFGILTGALELLAGVAARGREVLARDQILVGAATVLLGVVVLVVPVGLAAPFSGVDPNVSGVLTSSVIIVGLLGAWGIVSGVLLAIAAVTLRGADAEPTGTGPEVDS